MAVDEALLNASAARGLATLRFYQWSEPTLSLGYFQAYDDRQTHAASRDCPCVRRHSGGGAIMHDRELTYSLALPASQLPAGGPLALYNVVHTSLVRVLGDLLPSAQKRLELCGPQRKRPVADEPFLCFQRRSDGDVLVAPEKNGDSENPIRSADSSDKVIGSAQRKRRGAVLQHGSILLARSPRAPELPGIAELLGDAPDPAQLGERLAYELAKSLGFTLFRAELDAEERQSAEQIVRERFAAASWTRRR